MKPVLFSIGRLEIRVYSLMYIIALFVGIYLAKKDKKGIRNPKDIEDFAFISLFSGLIGARIYYVIFSWSYYSKNLLDIFAVYKGGLAIHGGIIGGALGVLYFAKKKGYSYYQLSDMAVSPLLLGQALGRIGNLANGEIHGVPTITPISVILKGQFNEWWQMYNSLSIAEKMQYKPVVPFGIVFPENTMAGMEFPNMPVHPAMIYEMILNIIGFLFMWFYLRNKNIKTGVLTYSYLIIYGIIRIIVSTFRAEDLMFLGVKMPYVISAVMIIVGIIGIWKINTKKS